ncbi:vacuolar protein sorting-associated protein 74 [Ceraceosorus bombacis]|uniref:Vacuolar protein sorting-associated protein 74 n=1 Tax=Ceraceosorus bombacis TaxID=401625 RepID=A0A0P1BGM4_9BASI|nr:vacuolar protein sorting-associated protein 74 [Ceraceosorus bombacis]
MASTSASFDSLPSRTGSPLVQHSNGRSHLDHSSSSSSNPTEGSNSAKSRTAAGAASISTTSQSGHRIAYDPRDLQDEGEEKENPRLTLMEECLLLGLKDKQGYLSFWNDNISYSLRGCILIELCLRKRISISRDTSASSGRFRGNALPLQDRLIEVVDGKMTGEVLLDETLKLMKSSERMSASQWVDLLSGETWNVTKIGYQLKQVRERLAKGLVDKGILRTEKRNFLLFDMATHPVSDSSAKDAVLRRVLSLLTSSTPTLHASALYREERKNIAFAATRSLSLLCCSFSANVLENALAHLSYDAREAAFQKVDDILSDFSQWPMAPRSGIAVGSGPSNAAAGAGVGQKTGIGEGSISRNNEEGNLGVSTFELAKAVRNDLISGGGNEAQFEAIAAVLYVLSRMDSLL